MEEDKIYTIKQILFDEKYAGQGAHSEIVEFEKRMPDGTKKMTTVWQHYREHYNFRLQHPKLPLIETTRGALFPMELCNVADFQRYPFKLDPVQASYDDPPTLCTIS